MLKQSLALLFWYGGTEHLSPLIDRTNSAFATALAISGALLAAFVIFLTFACVSPVYAASGTAPIKVSSFRIGIVVWGAGVAFTACVYFWIGYGPFIDAEVAPGSAYEIKATSSKGRWTFEYPNGKTSLNQLAVPRSQPIELRLSSADHMHELYLPRLNVRQTAIPGRYTSAWFQSSQVLSSLIGCVTFCPRGQAASVAAFRVLEPAQFDEWLSATRKTKDPSNQASPTPEASAVPPASASPGSTGAPDVAPEVMIKARKFYAERCVSCHGDKGNGDGPGAFAIKPRPRNYTDPEWQKTVTDDELAKAIVKGGAAVGKSYMMPASYDLRSKPELTAALVAMVRSFAQ